MSKEPSSQSKSLNSYYKAVMIQRNVITLLTVVIIVLTVGIVGIGIYSQSTYLVSIPGQSFTAQRMLNNPYRQYNAEQAVIDFSSYMFQFNANTYEEDIQKAQYFASSTVYNKWYNFYYVDKQQDTGEPLYYSFIKNELNMELEIEHMRSIEKASGFVVEFYGQHIYRKQYDYFINQEVPVHFVFEVNPNQTISMNNRQGYSIAKLEFDGAEWTSDVEESWTEKELNK